MTFKYGITPTYTPYFILNYGIIVLLSLASIYFFVMYFFGNKNKKNLTLTELCISVVFLTAFYNNWGITFSNIARIDFFNNMMLAVLTPLTAIIFIKFLYLQNKEYVSRVIIEASRLLFIIYIIAFVILLFAYDALIIPVLAILMLYFYACCVLISIRLIRANVEGSVMLFIGILFVVMTSITDFTFYVLNYTSYSIFLIGFVIFIAINLNQSLKSNSVALRKAQSMSDSYNRSIEKIKENENNFLSSHLKAHFLFNALNIIGGYAYYDTYKCKALTKSLKTYMKQLFDHENLESFNTLANEIDLAISFGYIEMERFTNLNINFDIQGDPYDVMVPSLILQPLIENAVNHGARKKNDLGSGTVDVKIIIDNAYARIEIKDDGAGCERSVLYKAINLNENNNYHSLYHIGHRLKTHYNEVIHFETVVGKGTILTFKIPVTRDASYSRPSQQ